MIYFADFAKRNLRLMGVQWRRFGSCTLGGEPTAVAATKALGENLGMRGAAYLFTSFKKIDKL